MSYAEQRASIDRLLERIDVSINGAGAIEWVIPMDTETYEEEDVDRDAFVLAMLIALRQEGFVFGEVYALDGKGGQRLLYATRRPQRQHRKKPTIHQTFAALRRPRRGAAAQRKRGVR